MEDKKTIVEEIYVNIKAPKKLFMGDPYYKDMVKDKEITRAKYNSLIFKKNFKEPFLIARCKITKERTEEIFEGMELDFTEIKTNIILSNDLRLVTVIEKGMMYSHQKIKTKEIGVDTATLEIETDKGYRTIKTGTDGYIGAVLEYKNGSNVDAVEIELGLDADLFTTEEVEKLIKSLFS